MGIFGDFIQGLSAGYKEVNSLLSFEYSSLLNVFIFALLIVLYSVFTYKFYKYLSKRDIIVLNLRQYNRSEHPVVSKMLTSILYFLEYIVILPFLIFFWFAILGVIILVLSEGIVASQIIVFTAALVASIRILAYYDENISQELAKIFPFTILVIFATNPSFFSIDRVLSNISQIPLFIGSIGLFLVLIAVLEIILRFVEIIIDLFQSEED